MAETGTGHTPNHQRLSREIHMHRIGGKSGKCEEWGPAAGEAGRALFNTRSTAEPMAVIIPVSINAPELAPPDLELYIASKDPKSMGIAMVKEGPITIKSGFLGITL